MATIDLGKIKMVWRGPYDNSTAYTPDDVVSSGGSSYICILASTGNAVSNATYWQQMAGKGTDADLMNIANTAQGDFYYNNGSAFARLAPGTANQLLKTGGAGANPSWTDAPVGGAISTHFATFAGSFNTNSNSYQTIGSGISLTMTPASTTSKILLLSSLNVYGDYAHLTYFRGSTNLATDKVSTTNRIIHNSTNWSNSSMSYIDQPNTTSSITYEIKIKASSSSSVYVGDGNQILNTFLAIEL